MTAAAYRGDWILSAIVEDRAERLGDRPAVAELDGRGLTYRELRDRTQRVAALLGELGVGPSARVATMLDPTVAHVEAALGCAWAGAVEVPVNTDYQGLYLQHVLAETEADTVILQDRFVERLAPLDLPALRHVVVVGDGAVAPPAGVATHRFADADGLAPATPVARTEEDLLIILYTSGTTGISKGAMHCNRSALWTARVWQRLAELSEDDVGYSYLPMFHVTARSALFLASVLAGGSTILRERFSVSSFWSDIRRFDATFTMYMGAVIHLLYRQEPQVDDAENPLRAAGGAAAPPDIGPAFKRRFGCELFEVFGMTEIGTATGGRMGHGTPGAMGKPFEHLQIEVHDEHDRPLPADVPGQLVVRPREPGAIFEGYWRRPQETLEAFRNLWFHTGDLGKLTPLGEVVFLDRLTDSMRRRGENISSFEVERSVNAHPAVLESAAFAVPSELTEHEVMVAVVPREDMELDLDELLRFCVETMPRFTVPRYARIVDGLPKTPTGRVQKHVLRAAGVTPDTIDREALGIVAPRR
jgi:crotonobetaine/carnitine-CoA ligase